MNAPLLPEVLLGVDSAEPELPLATEGVQRYVWQSRFGAILIEVKDGISFVNGQPVEPLSVTPRPSGVAMDDAGSQPWARVGRDAHAAVRRPLKTSVAIGFGSPAQDSGVTRLDLNDVLVRNQQATFLMRVSGDAMQRSGIDAGDLVLVDRAVEAQHGHVVIAVVEHEFVCRRLVRDGGVPTLCGDAGQDTPPREGEELRVWGVVTTVIKSLPV